MASPLSERAKLVLFSRMVTLASGSVVLEHAATSSVARHTTRAMNDRRIVWQVVKREIDCVHLL